MIILDITTHDGDIYSAEVEEYDALVTNDLTNDESLNTVVLGDIILSRINVKAIIPRISDEDIANT